MTLSREKNYHISEVVELIFKGELNCLQRFFRKQINIAEIHVFVYILIELKQIVFSLFKIFLEIFKDMKNASVRLYFEWTKEKTDRKSILLPRRRASC